MAKKMKRSEKNNFDPTLEILSSKTYSILYDRGQPHRENTDN